MVNVYMLNRSTEQLGINFILHGNACSPKKIFCCIQRFTTSICYAISQFNDGAKGRGIRTRIRTIKTFKSAAPANTVTKKYKKLCEMLQSARKKKRNTSDASYGIINLVRSQNFAKNILKE